MQFQICNSGEVWTSVSRAEANRIVRKRTGALAAMIRQQRIAIRRQTKEDRQAERGLQAEQREADRCNRALWKRIRVKPDAGLRSAAVRRTGRHGTTKSGWLGGASQLPCYSGQIFDRAARAGIFFRVRYYSSKTKPGVGRRTTLYIWRGAHETDAGHILFSSNVGETVDEAVAALEAIEMFNRETQAASKVLFHAIANVPYQLLETAGGVERMFEIGQRFAERQFASRDLPFAVALHPPSEEGDQRNWHLHLIFSTRPLVRTGDHEWDLGRMMRREIDNPAAFEEMRHLYAAVQTEVAQEAGVDIVYTALSNVERGLPNAPQKHLGLARTARVRRGQEDVVNERNREIMLAGEAALLDEQLRHEQERTAAEYALHERVSAQKDALGMNMTAGLQLAMAALDHRVRSMPELPADLLHNQLRDDGPVPAIANLQSRVGMAAGISVPSAGVLFDPGVAIELTLSEPQPERRSIDVPAVLPAIDDGPLRTLPISNMIAGRTRQYGLSVPSISAVEAGGGPVPSLSIAGPKLGVTHAQTGIAKPPSWAGRSLVENVGLSLGHVMQPIRRTLDVPPQSTVLRADRIDREIDDVFRGLEARKREIDVCQERTHRARLAQEQANADLLQQANEDERLLRLGEQQREAERAREEQVGQDASGANATRYGQATEDRSTQAAALETLRALDDWVAEEQPGIYALSNDAMRAASLTRVDLAGRDVQIALAAMYHDQEHRLDIVHEAPFGQPFRYQDGKLRLGFQFPAKLQRDVERWAENADFQSFVDQVWSPKRKERQQEADQPSAAETKISIPENLHSLDADLEAIAIDALRRSDDWVTEEETGQFWIAEDVLKAVGLTSNDLSSPAVQDALTAMGANQMARFEPVFDAPFGVIPFWIEQGELRLDPQFPLTLQSDVARWASNPQFRSFVNSVRPPRAAGGGVESATPVGLTASQSDRAVLATSPLTDPWMAAASMRQHAMAAWDRIENSGVAGPIRPGNTLARPGQRAGTDPKTPQRHLPAAAALHPERFLGSGGIDR